MLSVNIDEATALEKHIFHKLSENPQTGQVKYAKIPRDENGNPIGHTWEETREMMYDILSEHYGVNLHTL
ncbi:MAG: hypothetical protein LBT24_03015 [Tannerella sp.]|jgi:hypothetical protein|nr:hypothetical protein [Tannerella sp.]